MTTLARGISTADKKEEAPLPKPILLASRGAGRKRRQELPTDITPLEVIEREHIIKTFQRFEGNVTQCAIALKIGRATLYRKLNSYGLTFNKIK